MDQKTLVNTLMGDQALESVSRMSGASTQQVQQVLSAALPSLLQGARQQVGNSGFTAALADHAKDDTADLGGFFSHVDMTDGGKIVGHLLGDQAADTAEEAAERAGLSTAQTAKIIALAAPLLMSLLGQQSSQSSSGAAGLTSLLGGLLGGSGSGSSTAGALGGVLLNLLGSQTQTTSTGKKKKKKPTQSNQSADLLGSFLDLLK